MTLVANALTTVAQVRDLAAGKDVVPPDHDTLLEFFIASAGDFMERYCSRTFGKKAYTEKYIGHGRQWLILKNRPVLTTPAVVVTDNDSVVASTEYNVDTERGMLFREAGWAGGQLEFPGLPLGDPHPFGVRYNLQVQYTAGYVLPKDHVVAADSGLITVTVVAAAKTFTRAAGSFLSDGFAVGDTVTFSGFANAGNNGSKTIADVTATVITVSSASGLVNEAGTGDEQVVRTANLRTLPYDLEMLCARLALMGYKHRDKDGLSVLTSGDVAMTFDRMPDDLRTALDLQKDLV